MRATHAHLALIHAYHGYRSICRSHLLRLSQEREFDREWERL